MITINKDKENKCNLMRQDFQWGYHFFFCHSIQLKNILERILFVFLLFILWTKRLSKSDNMLNVCSEGVVSDTYQCYLSLPLSQVYLLRQFSNIIKLFTKYLVWCYQFKWWENICIRSVNISFDWMYDYNELHFNVKLHWNILIMNIR